MSYNAVTQSRRVGVVLAAGKGTRLKSDLPKVLHDLLGKPMLQRVLESFIPLHLDKVIVVVGHHADLVRKTMATIEWPFVLEYVLQEPQLGTGHALQQVLKVLPQETPCTVLITCGDTPLILSQRYATLLESQESRQTVASMVTVLLKDPTGYGRILTDGGQFKAIVEEKDATPEQKTITKINAGVYAVDWLRFSPYLDRLTANNAQQEFYLTDILGLIANDYPKEGVSEVVWPDPEELLGINGRHQLAEAVDILSRRTAQRLMASGVTLVRPETMTLSPEVQVAADTTLYPGCYLEGTIAIGAHCEIGPYTVMRGNVSIAANCRVVYAYLDKAVTVDEGTYIGPFAHLRDNARIGKQARVGNFVEVKETQFGSRSNAAHLCYLGDAVVGDDVNMGAGSITANYDPVRDKKHQTIIKDGVKVGCNSVLVAPVTIEARACVAAGSVITHNVASLDLAISRPHQVTLTKWVQKTLDAEQRHASSP